MRRLSNTLTLARESWNVLSSDKELLLLPLISGGVSLVVAASFLMPLFIGGGASSSFFASVLALIPVYLLLAYVTVFFNTALISAANERLEGGNPTLQSALRSAMELAFRILPWAFVSAAVSAILKPLEQRAGLFGQIITGLAGVAWTAVTFLVLPIIVIEGARTGRAVKKSGELLRSTWGENIAAQVGFGMIGFLLVLPGGVLTLMFAVAGGPVFAAVFILFMLWCIAVAVTLSALNAVYQTALYRYASGVQTSSGYFTSSALKSSFGARRNRYRG